MNYRILGRTGLKVSEIGLGGHEYRRFLPPAPDKRDKIDYEEIHCNLTIRNKILR